MTEVVQIWYDICVGARSAPISFAFVRHQRQGMKTAAIPDSRCYMLCRGSAYQDRFLELLVNAVPTVLYGDHAASPAAGNRGDGLAAVTAQREQECIQILIIGFDSLNNILFALDGIFQCHVIHLIHNSIFGSLRAHLISAC